MKNFALVLMIILGGCTPPSNNYNGHYKRIKFIDTTYKDIALGPISTAIYERFFNHKDTTTSKDIRIESIFFFTSEYGIIGGEKTIQKIPKKGGYDAKTEQSSVVICNTSDGGYHWNEVEIEDVSGIVQQFKYINNILYANVFFYPSKRYPNRYNQLYTSNDKGLSWQVKTGSQEITDFYFKDSLNGIIWDRLSFYTTNDGGRNYEMMPIYQSNNKKLLEINDSTAIFVLYPTDCKRRYLVSYDYVKRKIIYNLFIPNASFYYSYSDGMLLYSKDSTVYLDSIISDRELRPIYNHTFSDNILSPEIVKNGDNICIFFSIGIGGRSAYFSRNSGQSWTEIKYFRGSFDPEYVLFEKDTIMCWRNRWPGYFDYIKIDPPTNL